MRMTREEFEDDAVEAMFCTLRSVRNSGFGDWDVLTNFLANLCLGTTMPFGLNDKLHEEVKRKMRMVNQ